MTRKLVADHELGTSKHMPTLVTNVIILILIITAMGLLITACSPSKNNDPKVSASTSHTNVTLSDPYTIEEISGELDLSVLSTTSFVSIFVEDNGLTSYMASSETGVAKSLMRAVQNADEVKPAPAPSTSPAEIMIIFKLPTQEIVTFEANLEENLLLHGGKAWRTKENLKTLVTAIIKANTDPT